MKNILVVDDDPTIVTIIEELLQMNGFKTIPAADAEDAEAALKRSGVDLILLDVMMPKSNGFEFCKKIKGRPDYQSIPIIFVTVMNKKEDIEKGKALGAADFVTKPFDPSDLIARVKKNLNLN